MIQLRDYQQEAVAALWDYFRGKEGNPLVAMPTGTGKSLTIAEFTRSVLKAYPRSKILVVTHVMELIVQNYGALNKLWPHSPSGIYSAGVGRRDTRSSVIYCGIASVGKKAHEFGHVDMIIVDEAHLVSPNGASLYRTFIDDLIAINPYLKVIGFTATPYRLGSGLLVDGPIFTDMAYDITGMLAFNRLIANGYLSPLISKRTQTVLDTDGVGTSGGDFIQSQLQAAVDKEFITRAAIQESLEDISRRHSILVFGSGVEHCEHIAQYLNEYGVPAVAIHSKIPKDERKNGIAGFKAGYYKAAVSNNILTTGFDHPPADMIIGLRPTMSPNLWVQMMGRGTRPYDPYVSHIKGFDYVKENCLVHDYASNITSLGPINDPVLPKKKGKRSGPPPVKECVKCGCFNHASVRFCTGIDGLGAVCGEEFSFSIKLGVTADTGDLIKGDLPVVKDFQIDHISYSRHTKMNAPDSMKVSYYCGAKCYAEYVTLDHPNPSVRGKAQSWVRERFLYEDYPVTVDDLLERATQLRVATHIRVWVNQKYPTILKHDYTGTNFGKSDTPSIAPVAEVEKPRVTIPSTAATYDFTEDDLPF